MSSLHEIKERQIRLGEQRIRRLCVGVNVITFTRHVLLPATIHHYLLKGVEVVLPETACL